MEEAAAPSLVDLLQSTAQDRHVPVPDLSSDAASNYLDQLLSLPLKSLVDEATVISSEAAGVESELTNLCFREYPTFISVHKCSSAVTSAFDDFSSSLGKLLDAVPALEDECRAFVRSTKGVQDARAKALLVQEHQDKLFDLLEIPQLMDTCVRNGYYAEALELRAHAAALGVRYPGVALVQDVAREVDGVLAVLVAQLLALLREPIKLPALIKSVGYLRRLGSVGEAELGLVFLVSRLSNFRAHQNLLEGDRGDPVRYVRKYVDLFREHVFDIVSQFSTIFLECAAPSPAAAAHLASFVGQCVDDLVAVVGAHVPRMAGDAASLSSILVQLGYCALAFARVGLDFASLVTAPFGAAVRTAYAGALEDGATSLAATLRDAAKSAGSPTAPLIAGEYVPALLARESPAGFIAWGGGFEQLPAELSRLPPLAMLVNAHLGALNSLRLLAPLHLYPELAAAQAASLLACTHALAQYVRSVVALSDADGGGGGSARAHLLRRSSERELTPEERRARRRETQWVCVALADAWVRVVCPLLSDALARGVYDGAMPAEPAPELDEALHALQAWVDDQLEHHMGSPSPRKGSEAARSPSPRKSLDTAGVLEKAEEETAAEEEEPQDAVPTEEEIAALEASAAPVKTPTPPKTPELVMDTNPEPEPEADAEAKAEPAPEESTGDTPGETETTEEAAAEEAPPATEATEPPVPAPETPDAEAAGETPAGEPEPAPEPEPEQAKADDAPAASVVEGDAAGAKETQETQETQEEASETADADPIGAAAEEGPGSQADAGAGPEPRAAPGQAGDETSVPAAAAVSQPATPPALAPTPAAEDDAETVATTETADDVAEGAPETTEQAAPAAPQPATSGGGGGGGKKKKKNKKKK